MAINRKDITTARNGVSLQHRHFAFIANSILRTKPESDGPEMNQWRNVAYAFAADCRATNPKFNRERFLAACGITE